MQVNLLFIWTFFVYSLSWHGYKSSVRFWRKFLCRGVLQPHRPQWQLVWRLRSKVLEAKKFHVFLFTQQLRIVYGIWGRDPRFGGGRWGRGQAFFFPQFLEVVPVFLQKLTKGFVASEEKRQRWGRGPPLWRRRWAGFGTRAWRCCCCSCCGRYNVLFLFVEIG